ncbi:MAG: hypothetical protein WCV00_14715 [Verrucomicrobiia bacterium]
MKTAQRHQPQKQLSKRAKVGAIRETARRNGNHFPAFAKQLGCDSQKTRVEVACLNVSGAQQEPGPRIAVNLAVGRIEYGGVKRCLRPSEKVAADERQCRLYEIGIVNINGKMNAQTETMLAAVLKRAVQRSEKRGVHFIGHNVNAAWQRLQRASHFDKRLNQ